MIEQPRKILLPTDFSEPAEAAAPYAAAIARAFGAELHLLHAIVLHDDFGGPSFPEQHEVIEALQERAGDLLSALAGVVKQAGVEVLRAERRGVSAAPVILDYAEEQGIDLVVMATHGRRGFRKLFLGSVAEEVVRHASVPVLTVRDRDRMEGADGKVKILVAADLSPATATLVDHAALVAARTGASVCLLHAIQVLRPGVVYEALPEIPGVSFAELESEARGRLEALVRDSGLDAQNTTVEVVEQPPAAAILDRCAGDGAADLVIVAHRQRSGVDRLFLGSVADRVVNRCSVPVLTVPVEG
jgi:nucleotide-binding universal stress UspA family protein